MPTCRNGVWWHAYSFPARHGGWQCATNGSDGTMRPACAISAMWSIQPVPRVAVGRNQKFGEPDFRASRRTHRGGLETALWSGAAVGRNAGGSATVSRHVLPRGELD